VLNAKQRDAASEAQQPRTVWLQTDVAAVELRCGTRADYCCGFRRRCRVVQRRARSTIPGNLLACLTDGNSRSAGTCVGVNSDRLRRATSANFGKPARAGRKWKIAE
jgi:hypothetical protein